MAVFHPWQHRGSTISIAPGRHHHHSPDGDGAEENQTTLDTIANWAREGIAVAADVRAGMLHCAVEMMHLFDAAMAPALRQACDQTCRTPRWLQLQRRPRLRPHRPAVDIYAPGCPATAEALMYGMLQLKREVRNTKTARMWYRK
ncbi:hypothetical protein MYCTH_2129465 [Thermothelomyces thermophilus ATCC 42464]|uniref:NADH:ubiquinone oxidoreductase-like 20kDa subunit domain-containing protein n=1 Tax=Thermothelomyces thermophilus (strain ATCC 42464 / BCRC 31852 / DSM 1799) TaxID=573729 RepID=G2QIP8_THET4|nr:uncharacterized protein MYCTH_2129465 [Thermothelomyces thermophilus ATCC 42464]AEO60370.1 hypothetical protein MYCTH_2129465 [Thermothelomyces thermophilus ATCC 42464]